MAEHPIKALLTVWDGLYQQHHEMRYPFNAGRDSKMMKELLVLYDEGQIRGFMETFFEMDDPFIEQSGHSLGVFRGCLPKVILFQQRGRTSKVMSTTAARVFKVVNG